MHQHIAVRMREQTFIVRDPDTPDGDMVACAKTMGIKSVANTHILIHYSLRGCDHSTRSRPARMSHQYSESLRVSQPLWRRFGAKVIATAIT